MSLQKRSVLIAAFSTVVEWYDFTLYIYLSTVMARVFFGGGEASLLAALAGFAIAYLMRPIGALAFGWFGDRRGRRTAMLWSMTIMSLAMAATAALPTYEQAGAWSGVMLLLLRCVMGFSVGGEYTGVVAYLLESAPEHRRGLVASLASAASEIGALLAVAAAATVVHLFSPKALDEWAWRLPFALGAVLAGLVWIARSQMAESPEFERQRRTASIPQAPLLHILSRHKAAVARGFAISALGSVTYYVGITYAPAFMTGAGGLSEGRALWLATLAALAVIVITPVVGFWSDSIGRKPVLITLCIASAIAPIGLFSLLSDAQGGAALIGVLALAMIAGGVSA
ncbi:hypothetical protein LTR94_026584, partial [Friedmanniomyces endolithicus]